MNIDKLASVELVALAENRGLTREIRGMSMEQAKDFLKKNKGFEELKEEILSWPALKRLAKSKGINTYKKKRDEIESLIETIRETENGEEKNKEESSLNDNGTAKMPKTGSGQGNKDVLIENLLIEANTAMLRIKKLEQRIDKIILAHEKCKSLKGI